MTQRMIVFLLGGALALTVASCGGGDDMPLLAGNTQQAVAEGTALYQQAKAADDAGDSKKAVKLYDRVANRYPQISEAAQARFRQAELLEQRGDVLDAFKAYQKFLTRFQGSALYATALERQARMAQDAADGTIKNSFLGIKSRLSTDKLVEMLGQVRDNAPQSPTASKAQFTIGELHRADKKATKAIEAYRTLVRDQPESKEAPDAMFQIGVALTEEANRGNQNLATIDLAREAFNDYLNQYPGHPRNAEARQRIASLGAMDLDRTFEVAEYYYKTKRYDSAKHYYRDVLRRAPSGPLHNQAADRLRELGE